MYYVSLCFSEIKELYESPSMKDVEPISGYLSFPAGTSLAYIPISSIDDNEEEADDVFSVRLISAKGGARVSENDAAAILTGTHTLSSQNLKYSLGTYKPGAGAKLSNFAPCYTLGQEFCACMSLWISTCVRYLSYCRQVAIMKFWIQFYNFSAEEWQCEWAVRLMLE